MSGAHAFLSEDNGLPGGEAALSLLATLGILVSLSRLVPLLIALRGTLFFVRYLTYLLVCIAFAATLGVTMPSTVMFLHWLVLYAPPLGFVFPVVSSHPRWFSLYVRFCTMVGGFALLTLLYERYDGGHLLAQAGSWSGLTKASLSILIVLPLAFIVEGLYRLWQESQWLLQVERMRYGAEFAASARSPPPIARTLQAEHAMSKSCELGLLIFLCQGTVASASLSVALYTLVLRGTPAAISGKEIASVTLSAGSVLCALVSSVAKFPSFGRLETALQRSLEAQGQSQKESQLS
jgi:hypothetical protein